ncbi:MAG TPA: hypothetical protein VND15_03260 [Candidatus Acidoferrales bacterium]|nr:hypothetical protein [Candidatus Acidoferrales bacterium]
MVDGYRTLRKEAFPKQFGSGEEKVLASIGLKTTQKWEYQEPAGLATIGLKRVTLDYLTSSINLKESEIKAAVRQLVEKGVLVTETGWATQEQSIILTHKGVPLSELYAKAEAISRGKKASVPCDYPGIGGIIRTAQPAEVLHFKL